MGSGPRAQKLARRVSAPDGDRELVGFLDSIEEDEGPSSPFVRTRLVGALEDLEEILMRTAVDEVAIGLPIRSHYAEIQKSIEVCERMGVESRYPADLFEPSLARPSLVPSGGVPLVALKVVPDDFRLGVKRVIDIIGAFVGIVVLAPLLVAIAIAIKLSSPGPVIFAQDRYGHNRRLFRMYKFRSMVPDAERLQGGLEHLNEAGGPAFKIKDDPRVTGIGRLLRRTSMDELPQLFNVLRGDMSLVGPRPLPTRDVHHFSDAWLMRRFSMPPGLTCLWQISGRSNLDFDDWITLDLRYIDGWSLGLDLRILAMTVPVVLRGTGAT